ncbi:MAG: IS30 family transposase, partial [Bacillariaceae sp.]
LVAPKLVVRTHKQSIHTLNRAIFVSLDTIYKMIHTRQSKHLRCYTQAGDVKRRRVKGERIFFHASNRFFVNSSMLLS